MVKGLGTVMVSASVTPLTVTWVLTAIGGLIVTSRSDMLEINCSEQHLVTYERAKKSRIGGSLVGLMILMCDT